MIQSVTSASASCKTLSIINARAVSRKVITIITIFTSCHALVKRKTFIKTHSNDLFKLAYQFFGWATSKELGPKILALWAKS